MKHVKLLCFALLLVAFSCRQPEMRFPGESWEKYMEPEMAGWSSELLAGVKELSDSFRVASMMIIHKGAVVDAWGDLDRRFMCHSVRKSFLSALFGIHIGTGEIHLKTSLADLGIDDKDSLSASEKEATISHLLRSRSGVYHPAAYETQAMKDSRPARGSHPPGTFYYYNNWDFNVLAEIFRKLTGRDVFTAFAEEIAGLIGMQDLRPQDCYFHLEPEHSVYPAYPFRMSTRDAARFGLLYLNEGMWGKARVLPEQWVRVSQEPYSRNVRPGRGYSYLWWISEEPGLRRYRMYNAAGVGGQIIAVLPGLDLVIVQRVNTYLGHDVPYNNYTRLFNMIVEAKTSRAVRNPVFVRLEESPGPEFIQPPASLQARLEGIYLQQEEEYSIMPDRDGNLLFHMPGGDRFFIRFAGNSLFLLEDMEMSFEITWGKDSTEVTLSSLYGRDTLLFERRVPAVLDE